MRDMGSGLPPIHMAPPSASSVTVSSPGPPVATSGAPARGSVAVVPVVGAPGVSNARTLSMQVTAAVGLSGHRVVTPLPDGSVRYAASNRMLDRWAPLWLTAGAAAAGELVEVVTRGPIDEPSWSWTVGPVYLSEEGRLTQVTPTRPRFMFVAQVGTATSPTSVFVDRFQSVVLAP